MKTFIKMSLLLAILAIVMSVLTVIEFRENRVANETSHSQLPTETPIDRMPSDLIPSELKK